MSRLPTVWECPAYRVIEAPTLFSDGSFIDMRHGDTYACKIKNYFGEPRWKIFTAGSVTGYFVGNPASIGDTLEKNIEQNRKNGGTDHWMNANCVSISNMKVEQKTHYALAIGDHVAFEGVAYKVAPANNENLALVAI